MPKRMLAFVAALGLIVPVALLADPPTPPPVHPGGRQLQAALAGSTEVPVPGDPDGSGRAWITVNPGKDEVHYKITVQGIGEATAAHIHKAPAGEAGPVVIPLTAPTGGMTEGVVSANRKLLMDILQHPSDYYVNVHNAEYPGGALRGQLMVSEDKENTGD